MASKPAPRERAFTHNKFARVDGLADASSLPCKDSEDLPNSLLERPLRIVARKRPWPPEPSSAIDKQNPSNVPCRGDR